MKKLLGLTIGVLFTTLSIAQSSFGEIIGHVYENSTDRVPAAYTKVWVEDNGAKLAATTDMDGKFRISAIPAGQYKLSAFYMGDSLKQRIICNVVPDGIEDVQDIFILEDVKTFEGIKVIAEIKLKIDDVGQTRIRALDIKRSPSLRDPAGLITSYNSDVKVNAQGEMMIRGARPGDMAYFIDGVKLREAKSIPGAALQGVTVYTSAIPAKYGDTNGGVIVMNTKSYADLYRRWKIMTTAPK